MIKEYVGPIFKVNYGGLELEMTADEYDAFVFRRPFAHAAGIGAPVLSATLIDDTYADLTWTAPNIGIETFDHYDLQRSTDGVNYTTISQPMVTTYHDSPLVEFTTYYWRVRIVTTTENGPWSNVLIGTTAAFGGLDGVLDGFMDSNLDGT